MIRIAILASGSGSNAEAIMKHFRDSERVKIVSIITNNKNAGVLKRAEKNNIPSIVINSKQTEKGELLSFLKAENIQFIVLAGYMRRIPKEIIAAYPKKIVNIHPALLPKYGGKGMFGMHVHEAVVVSKEVQTGLTIHFVNEHYDEGAIIFQDQTNVSPEMTANDVAEAVLKLEHLHYPNVIEEVINSTF